MNVSTGTGSSTSNPRVQKDLRPLRSDLSSFLQAFLANRTGIPSANNGSGGKNDGGPFGLGKYLGYQPQGNNPEAYGGSNFDIFTNPGGQLGGLYSDLFNRNGQDFLGTRGALESTLSGQGFGDAYNIALQQLMPGTMSQIAQGMEGLKAGAGVNGLRFSTDLMKNQGNLASQMLLGTMGQAANTGMGVYNQRAQTSQGMYDLISNLSQQDLARQLPLLLQYASGFAPVGSSSTQRSSGFGVL